MTVKEAIKELEYDKELYNTDAQGKPLDRELLEGTPDGALVDALDMAIEALRKQEPKEPEFAEPQNYRGGLDEAWDCPTCGGFLAYKCDATDSKYRPDYCPNCGQCIDWSEQEESEE